MDKFRALVCGGRFYSNSDRVFEILDEYNADKRREWNWCPFCRGHLDTGWECSDCGADLMPYAYPRWRYRLDKLKRWVKKWTR